MTLEDSPHGGCAHVLAEPGEFAADSPVAPGRVVGGHVDDESADLNKCGWPTRASDGLGPVTGDSSPMPAQQGVGGDEPSAASEAGECVGDRGEQRPITVIELRSVVLSAQHHQLVAQDDDLKISRTTRADGQTSQRRQETVQDARHDP